MRKLNAREFSTLSGVGLVKIKKIFPKATWDSVENWADVLYRYRGNVDMDHIIRAGRTAYCSRDKIVEITNDMVAVKYWKENGEWHPKYSIYKELWGDADGPINMVQNSWTRLYNNKFGGLKDG